eukprot:tig00001181_g7426.t1
MDARAVKQRASRLQQPRRVTARNFSGKPAGNARAQHQDEGKTESLQPRTPREAALFKQGMEQGVKQGVKLEQARWGWFDNALDRTVDFIMDLPDKLERFMAVKRRPSG